MKIGQSILNGHGRIFHLGRLYLSVDWLNPRSRCYTLYWRCRPLVSVRFG